MEFAFRVVPMEIEAFSLAINSFVYNILGK